MKTQKENFQFCRTCYDHLAGKVAVDLTEKLLKQKVLIPKDGQFIVSAKGEEWFNNIGLNINNIEVKNRHFARPCLDGTEKKPHLAGALGAAFLMHIEKSNWIKRDADSRIVFLTDRGIKYFPQISQINADNY